MVLNIPIEYESFLNRSIGPIHRTPSGLGSNGNESVLQHFPQIFREGVSPSNEVYYHKQ